MKGTFKPGTIALFILIALLGVALFNWASENINAVGDETSRQQELTVGCAGLETRFVEVDDRGENTTVYFEVGDGRINSASVKIVGDRNYTERIEEMRQNSLQRVSGRVGEFQRVRVEVQPCDQVFEYRG